MVSTLGRQFLCEDENQFKMRINSVETSLSRARREAKMAQDKVFNLECEKDGLIASNPVLSRKRDINKRFCEITNIARNGQKYTRETHRLIQGYIIAAYNEMETFKKEHPNNLKKQADLNNKFSTKYIYDQVKKKDKRVLQKGEGALKGFIRKQIYIFEHRDEDIKHNKTDSKTCRELYTNWYIKLCMD